MAVTKKDLSDILKDAGLDVGEDAAIAAVKAVFKALPKIALATENKIDDLVAPVLLMLEPKLVEMLDAIYDDEAATTVAEDVVTEVVTDVVTDVVTPA